MKEVIRQAEKLLNTTEKLVYLFITRSLCISAKFFKTISNLHLNAIIFFMVLATIMVVLAGCETQEGGETGSLALKAGTTGSNSVSVLSYDIALKGPDNRIVNASAGEDGVATIDDLEAGSWIIAVSASDENRVTVGSKNETVEITGNKVTACEITVVIDQFDPDPISDPEPGTELKGWQLNETNTGFKGNYSNLTEFNLNGADAGKGIIESGMLVLNAGVTVSNRIITTPCNFRNSGVTLDHCLIRPRSIGTGVPIVTGSNITILDSEIDGSQIPDSQIVYTQGISFYGTMKRTTIHGVSTGIFISNSTGTQTVVENNYVYGLRYISGTDAHLAGLTIRRNSGGGAMLLKNNRIVIATTNSSGPCFIQAWQGLIDNVTIEGNLLQGYGYSLVLEAKDYSYGSNMRSINNRLDPWNGWVTYVMGGPGWREWTGNYKYSASAADCKGAVVNKP